MDHAWVQLYMAPHLDFTLEKISYANDSISFSITDRHLWSDSWIKFSVNRAWKHWSAGSIYRYLIFVLHGMRSHSQCFLENHCIINDPDNSWLFDLFHGFSHGLRHCYDSPGSHYFSSYLLLLLSLWIYLEERAYQTATDRRNEQGLGERVLRDAKRNSTDRPF
jgi:hypothetical protein